ncbi:hypothetical protein [Desulfurobacterium sp. TC5-1]|uniref:tetratricopeptide repeat protein n=1 Tax=Desulfurobacterium sp. TC5-1 TaxID=1158318 RepID=UPI0003B51979|nr:hypothetical protein [Desulfurobacterium sp. TC5-1]
MKKLAVVYLSLIVFTGTAFPAENLGNMFKNQDYDEIIGILQNVPEQRLSAEELLYLGFSMLMTGNYKKGERLLRLSFQKKPLPETGKILAEIYFSRRNYQKVIEIYKKLGRHVPDEVKLLTALSYRALNKNETAKSIAEQIKNPELKLKTGLPVKTVKVFSTIQYDSNPLFIPEDEFKETFGGWMINTGFKYSAISRNSSWGVKTFVSYQINRDNRFLDYISLSPFYERKSDDKTITLSPYYIYTDDSSYILGFQTGLKGFSLFSTSFTAGGEINLETSSKNALYAKINSKIKDILVSVLYKNFASFPDKIAVKTVLTLKRNITEVAVFITPYLNMRYYTDGSRNIIPGCSVIVEKSLSNLTKISTELRYEKGFGSGSLEDNYSRYVAGLTFSGSF